ncbi:hypothetical protein [Haloarchaeobius amylolyticus]|uniref:hypothetical protein n=1 Tax=Haloarchaeobius amylolyticus TaxID=1198296 RepID=UPI00226D9A9B|nr:hypothetical protein [Haloarchaeobius amylolyticus]
MYTWQYYDLVLLGVASSMLTGVGVGALTTVSMSMAIVATGLVAAAIIGHGLFVNGPIDQPDDLTDEVDALN